jgi:hypothetical protein
MILAQSIFIINLRSSHRLNFKMSLFYYILENYNIRKDKNKLPGYFFDDILLSAAISFILRTFMA